MDKENMILYTYVPDISISHILIYIGAPSPFHSYSLERAWLSMPTGNVLGEWAQLVRVCNCEISNCVPCILCWLFLLHLNNFILNINGKFTDFVIGKAIADAKLPFVHDTPTWARWPNLHLLPQGVGSAEEGPWAEDVQ